MAEDNDESIMLCFPCSKQRRLNEASTAPSSSSFKMIDTGITVTSKENMVLEVLSSIAKAKDSTHAADDEVRFVDDSGHATNPKQMDDDILPEVLASSPLKKVICFALNDIVTQLVEQQITAKAMEHSTITVQELSSTKRPFFASSSLSTHSTIGSYRIPGG
ncbi:hypothetical protein KP509_32G070100 [Ceratopteris richardii]|uniref:Uncharacterized protein n=1 Tax=Ceratopteris richardii TaxID=49495 RepID=A0A8T2QW14_CERRI|nr:hypothetical protein KP509_32G070100 [Ceratopteris richardii]